ncbi:MAG TPA: hypothetical protein DCY20_08655, partial [Firmicutes bacterium]|nr:hypothetical protein [Bacillota bacterium]
MSKKITGYQLAIILYLCRSYTTLTHKSGEQDLMIVLYSIVLGVLIQFLFLIPAYILYKRYKTSNIITISKQYSSTLA